MPIAQNPPSENFYLSPLITFSVYSANSVVNRFLFILFTTRKKRRCAERGNKKAKYYYVAAILYRVRFRSLSIETLKEKAKGARQCSLLVARSPPLVTFNHFLCALCELCGE